MAKKKISRAKKASSSDKGLMLLAACAAVIVGFFAIFSYKNESIAVIPTPTPSVITVQMSAINRSNEAGTLTLQEVSGKVVVSLVLTGYPAYAQAANIRAGSCASLGATRYTLTSVKNGVSTTTLNTTLSELKSMGAMALSVGSSSCGNLTL